MTEAPLIRVENAVKSFGGLRAVDGVSLEVGRGEFLALLGPSGCGKTTLLRAIAGLESLDSGRIDIAGIDMTAAPPYRRPVNMMFQSYALFPHLTVAGNVAFGLKQENLGRAEIDRRVAEALALVRLDDAERRKPDRLSGGQKQRVALARALVKKPIALLLDEPLAALDRKLREATRGELVGLQRRLATSFVMVTHDQEEALATASRVAVMREGRILQVGSPSEIYESPASRWIAEFIGQVNIVDARLLADDRARAEALGLDLALPSAPGRQAGTPIALAIRPERIQVDGEPRTNWIDATVVEAGYLGDRVLLRTRLPSGATLKVSIANSDGVGGNMRVGREIRLSWAADAATVLTE